VNFGVCVYAVAPDLLLQGAGIWEVAFGQAKAQAADADGGPLPVASPDLPSIPRICERAKASEDQNTSVNDGGFQDKNKLSKEKQ